MLVSGQHGVSHLQLIHAPRTPAQPSRQQGTQPSNSVRLYIASAFGTVMPQQWQLLVETHSTMQQHTR